MILSLVPASGRVIQSLPVIIDYQNKIDLLLAEYNNHPEYGLIEEKQSEGLCMERSDHDHC